jgi:hypothetical protein
VVYDGIHCVPCYDGIANGCSCVYHGIISNSRLCGVSMVDVTIAVCGICAVNVTIASCSCVHHGVTSDSRLCGVCAVDVAIAGVVISSIDRGAHLVRFFFALSTAGLPLLATFIFALPASALLVGFLPPTGRSGSASVLMFFVKALSLCFFALVPPMFYGSEKVWQSCKMNLFLVAWKRQLSFTKFLMF